jgi:hypothetical protein
MELLKQISRVVAIFLFVLVMWVPVTQAASQGNELIKVTVNVIIENPDYFWRYPFEGKQLDGIRVSALGKSFNVQPASNGQKIEFDVPKDYKFRVTIGLQNNDSTFKEMSYITKWGLNERNGMLNITLKAPEFQSITIMASSFDEVHRGY